MRKIELDGKVAMLTEKQYNQLLRRFDVSAAKIVNDEFSKEYHIDRKCICPDKLDCESCPFKLFASNFIGCISLLEKLKLIPEYGMLDGRYIYWSIDDDAKARVEITAIYNALLTLERV